MSRDSIAARPARVKRATIYAIENTVNGRVYVGSTADFTQRQYQHLWELSRGEHRNPGLQADYAAHGAAVFTFSALERCPADQMRAREEYWLAHYRTSQEPYNIRAADVPSATPEQSRQAWLRAFRD